MNQQNSLPPQTTEQLAKFMHSLKKEHQDVLSINSQLEFWNASVGIMVYQISVALPLIVCSYLIGSFGDAYSLSVFGLGNTFINLAFSGFLFGISENLGVHSSKLFSQKKFAAMNNLAGKCLTMILMLILLTLFLFNSSQSILLFFGFERDVVAGTYEFLQASRLFIIFMAINFNLTAYLISQDLSRQLLYINASMIVLIFFLGRYFVVTLDLREMGVPYARFLQEFICFFCYMYLLIFKAEKATYTNFDMRAIFSGYLEYVREIFLTISNFYSELVCFEVNIYFVGLLHNLSEMALWITLINSTGIIFAISIALSNSMRTILGHLIGRNKLELARIKSIHFFIYMGMFSFVFLILTQILKFQIAWIFTGSEYLTSRMGEMYFIYGFNIFPTLTLYSLNTIFRILDEHELLFRVNTVYNVILTISLSYLFCFGFDLRASGINVGFMISKNIIVLFCFYQLYWKIEWKVPKDMILSQTEYLEMENLKN